MYYAFQDASFIYMVMEFVQGGDMVNFMSVYDPDEEIARFYIAELSVALDFLHGLGFIHRDVKPDNMLLDKNGHLKLCDFGTSIRMDKNGEVRCSIAVGTPDYISPEVLSSQCQKSSYGRACDWWSVGVFLYELIVGDTPFYSQSLVGTYNNISTFKTSLKIPEDVEISESCCNLIRAFLSDATVRLGRKGIDDIKKHSFFKDVPWTWENIRNFTPPVIPELEGELDTSCFEEYTESKESAIFVPPDNPFSGDHFPFVGFSFSRDFVFDSDKKPKSNILSSSKHPIPHTKTPTSASELLDKMDKEINANASFVLKIKELNELISKKEEEIRKLVKINNDNEHKLVEAKQKSQDQLSSFKNSFKEQTLKLQSKVKELEEECLDNMQKIKKYEAQLKILKISEHETKSRYEDLRDENQPLKDTIDKLKLSNINIENEILKLNNQLQESQNSAHNIQIEYSLLKTEFDSLDTDINVLKTIFSCSSVVQLIDTIKATRLENDGLHKKLISCQLEIKNYDEMLKKQKPIDQLNNLHLNLKYNNLLAEQQNMSNCIDDLNKRCAELTEKYEQAAYSLRNSTNENITISSKLKDLNCKNSAMSLAETRLLLEKKDLIEKQTQLNCKLERAYSLLEETEKRMALFEEQVSYSDLRLNMHITKTEELKKEFNEQNSLICDLKSSIDVLTNQNKNITSQLYHKENEIEELNANLVKIEAELLIYSNDFNESLLRKNHIQSETYSSILTADSQTSELNEARTKAHKVECELIEITDKFNKFKIQAERTIASERTTKEEAVKKLSQVVLNNPMMNNVSTISAKNKSTYRIDRKFEQQHKLLEMELMKETNKKNELTKNYEAKITELNTIIAEQQYTIELYNKEKSIEDKYQAYTPQPRPLSKLVGDMHDLMQLDYDQIIKQSFLYVPSKSAKSSRKIGWNRVIATLTKNYLTVYKGTEMDQSSILYQIKIELIYYVRAISQNDLIRSSPNDILKIFQVIYTEENSPTEPIINDNSGDKYTIISNHCLINIQYHMPATCDVCGKGLWGFIKSSYAMECKNCHFKCHKEHASEPRTIPNCRDYDQRRMAKEILLMASCPKEQKNWIDVLMGLMKSITTSHQSSRSSIVKSSKESLGKSPLSIPESPSPITQKPI